MKEVWLYRSIWVILIPTEECVIANEYLEKKKEKEKGFHFSSFSNFRFRGLLENILQKQLFYINAMLIFQTTILVTVNGKGIYEWDFSIFLNKIFISSLEKTIKIQTLKNILARIIITYHL